MSDHATMLPVSEAWYRRLLGLALVLGIGGGAAALLYSGVTGYGTNLFFGEPTQEPWSGQWWWIPLGSGGAVVVVLLRRSWSVPDKVPGAVGLARRGWVDPSSALSLFVISAVSLFVGASLGPSFGIIVSSGGLGAWLSQRFSITDTEAKSEYTLTGMAAGLGAIFSAPLFASIMASELSSTPKRNYVAAFIPQLVAATIGYVIFFGLTGKVMLDAFDVPGYEYETIHLIYGVALGIFAVAFVLIQTVIGKVVDRVTELVEGPLIRAAAFGAVVGLIAFALPLTATGGSSQLAYQTSNIAGLGIGLLSAVLIGKMVAFTLSERAGFLGGPVFPILFLGGTAGILVHLIIPAIPAPLSVAAIIAAMPGAILGAPVSFILIGAGSVGVGIAGLAPVGMAVVTAHLAVWSLKVFSRVRDSV